MDLRCLSFPLPSTREWAAGCRQSCSCVRPRMASGAWRDDQRITVRSTPQPDVARRLMLGAQLLSSRFVGCEKLLISVQQLWSACYSTYPCYKEYSELSFISQSPEGKCLIRSCLHRTETPRRIARLAFLRQAGEPSLKHCHD